MKKYLTLANLAKVVAAAIMLQTLFFKFAAHPESVALFTQLDMEPWGRVGTGIAELVASILLFVPKTLRYAALLTIALMAGAIYFHLTILGIDMLFWMAVIVMVAGLYLLWTTYQYSTKK
jgi:putative oxidoreductase